MKKDEVMIHATTWINFENIMPNESHKRPHIVWFCLYKISRRQKYRDRKWASGCLELGEGAGGMMNDY